MKLFHTSFTIFIHLNIFHSGFTIFIQLNIFHWDSHELMHAKIHVYYNVVTQIHIQQCSDTTVFAEVWMQNCVYRTVYAQLCMQNCACRTVYAELCMRVVQEPEHTCPLCSSSSSSCHPGITPNGETTLTPVKIIQSTIKFVTSDQIPSKITYVTILPPFRHMVTSRLK